VEGGGIGIGTCSSGGAPSSLGAARQFLHRAPTGTSDRQGSAHSLTPRPCKVPVGIGSPWTTCLAARCETNARLVHVTKASGHVGSRHVVGAPAGLDALVAAIVVRRGVCLPTDPHRHPWLGRDPFGVCVVWPLWCLLGVSAKAHLILTLDPLQKSHPGIAPGSLSQLARGATGRGHAVPRTGGAHAGV